MAQTDSCGGRGRGPTWAVCTVGLLAMWAGCSRTHYRVATDEDAYGLLAQKSVARPWQVPAGFNIQPDPLSRFFDPTCIEDPLLPAPAPQLYAYRLPTLPSQMAARGQGGNGPSPAGAPQPSGTEPPRGDAPSRLPPVTVQEAAYLSPVDQANLIALVADAAPTPLSRRDVCADDELPIPKISPRNWQNIPHAGLVRMLEFETVRGEYRQTFGGDPPQELRDSSDRLTLEDIIYLACINSREYQTQKETLYRSALTLSLERYRFSLKFSTSGNGGEAGYQHSMVDGESQSSFDATAEMRVDKVLATGGDLVARFANEVVLTFNGPQGFAADVTSDALFDFSQSLLQRDIVFESLTQSERDVVYAARDYARFRKQLFVQLAGQYYALLRTYREIEIAAQNYFQLVRAFSEREAEYEAGQTSRIQVDQVEQSLLGGRRALVATTNSLETALDNLKIRIGLPTEMLLNVDLKELEQLTMRDALAVNSELIRRTRDDRLLKERQKDAAQRNPDILLSASSVLLDQMVRANELRGSLGDQQVDVRPLRARRARLEMKLARSEVNQARADLKDEEDNAVVSEPRLLQATEVLNQSLGRLICRQLQLAGLLGGDINAIQTLQQRLDDWGAQEQTMRLDLEEMLATKQTGRMREFLTRARQSQVSAEAIVQAADQLLGMPAQPPTPEADMAETLQEVDELLAESGKLFQSGESGLTPVNIQVDDAMLTALVLRLDLINERGALADDWRRIKLAADDLKSIINFNASQYLSTTREWNQPFGDDTTDTARTQLRLSFDAPLNRRSQRNAFRRSLINYQASLRGLMLAEDNIKLAVRQDLRNLSLDKEQYGIDVASAALAYQRVVSTRQEIRLPGSGVTSRDFLEAQSDYVQALSTVASRHIDYILDRMDLFLDTELLTVDDRGFWNELYDEKFQPEPYYQLPPYAMPAYGELPPWVWYSKDIKRMCQVPPAVSTVTLPPGEAGQANNSPPPAASGQPEAIDRPPALEPPAP